MPHTNMELRVLPVQLAMLEVAGTISATKVGAAGVFVIPHLFVIERNCSQHYHIMIIFSLVCHERATAIVLLSAVLHSVVCFFVCLFFIGVE